MDSLNSISGFLGWKDERDNLGLGEESQKDKIQRIWDGIYKIDSINKLANNNIKLLEIELGLLAGSNKVKLEKNSIITQYYEIISGSTLLNFIEFLIDKWFITALGIFLVALTTKKAFVVVLIIEITVFAVFFYLGYKWEINLENRIKDDIVNNYMISVDNTIETLLKNN